MLLDPPHYSIYIGKSEHIRIRNFKSFSTRGWSDGIDMLSSSHIEIEDVFLRTSVDCIAIGFDKERTVDSVTVVNLRINGEWILDAEQGNFDINEHAHGIRFYKENPDSVG